MWRVPERRKLYKERKWTKIGYWERVREKEHEVQLEKTQEGRILYASYGVTDCISGHTPPLHKHNNCVLSQFYVTKQS